MSNSIARFLLLLLFFTIPVGAQKQFDPTPPPSVRIDPAVPQTEPAEADFGIEAEQVRVLYEALAVQPVPKQRVAIAALHPLVKAALWRHNIDVFRANHPELSSEQRAFLGAIYARYTPRFFAIEPSAQVLAALKAQADAVLSPPLQYEVFYSLGVRNGVTRDQLASGERPIIPESAMPPCQCSSRIDCGWDFWNYYCQIDIGFGCVPVPHNCGWSFLEACDGWCV